MSKRPCDRNLRDAELISCRLRRVEPLCRLPGSALQQLAMCGFYEDLEKVFRAGEQGRFWYAVLGGSLEVRYHAADADGKVRINIICTTFICRSARWTPKERFVTLYFHLLHTT
uniref:Cyclic nucleotide-binding domain-containing protein n=1 Tax=Phlebotomus papatasi TaxID=29031 RepID=A0A1B0D7U4_PHLPP